MSKVTNYALSKKLSEIGFKPGELFEYCYKKDDEEGGIWNRAFEVSCWEDEDLNNYYAAWDLETILRELPTSIFKGSLSDGGEAYLIMQPSSPPCKEFWGSEDYKKYPRPLSFGYERSNIEFVFCAQTIPSESLADAAARLLIQLYEKNIINFENEK